MLAGCSLTANAQRNTDKLDRGLVATVAHDLKGNFVSWRIFGEEYYDVTYNLYADGVLIAKELKVSNFTHDHGTETTKYEVAPVIRGKEGTKCKPITRWKNFDFYKVSNRYTGWLDIPGKPVINRKGEDVTYNNGNLMYWFNDITLADVDGDGVVEMIAKRNSASGR